MKTIGAIVVFMLTIIISQNSAFAQKSLSGKITDKVTSEPLVGVTVYIPDLKTGAITDLKGEYVIHHLPQGKFIIQIKYVSYATITDIIDLGNTSVKDFAMIAAATEISEVVITGSAFSSDQKRNSTAITAIGKQELKMISSTNIINALANIPGISEITTGGAVSKPVIRGLGYNHVITLSEGIRQEGNQWGDEHGIEIDEFSVDRVEILKGPASLFYGSDAMGGVVNIPDCELKAAKAGCDGCIESIPIR